MTKNVNCSNSYLHQNPQKSTVTPRSQPNYPSWRANTHLSSLLIERIQGLRSNLTFQTSKAPRQAMSLAGGVFSHPLHFHPQSPDGASVPRCSPQQIMEKSNNGQLRSIRPRFPDGSGGSHVELLTSAPTYKEVPPTHPPSPPLPLEPLLSCLLVLILWSMEKRRRRTNMMAKVTPPLRPEVFIKVLSGRRRRLAQAKLHAHLFPCLPTCHKRHADRLRGWINL